MNFKRYIAQEAYHGFLRKPVSLTSSLLLNLNLYPKKYRYEILQAHFNTSEIAIPHLTKLYEHLQPSSSAPHISLFHIPKTAGTSVRVAIGKELGIAPISNYRADSLIQPENWKSIAFWPYLAGHTSVFNFPKSHTGVTFFREPRSRLLSSYRQIEKGALSRGIRRSTKDEKQLRNWEQISSQSFSDWLFNAYERTTARFFFPGTEAEFFNAITSQSDEEIRGQLREGLHRVEYAGWSHESSSIESILRQIFGKPIQIPRLNIFNQESEYRLISLTPADLETIKSVTRFDQLLIDVAGDMGLIKPLTTSTADAIFEESAQRLGFRLP